MDSKPVRYEKPQIQKAFADFDITSPISDTEFDQALDYVMCAMLFGTAYEEPFMADPSKRRKIPDIFTLPLSCRADECEFASLCPVLKAMKNSDRLKLVGTQCRWERQYATEMFADLARTVNLSPEETMDVISVTDIVRNKIYKRRIDLHLSKLGSLYEDTFAGINQRTGQVYTQKTHTELLKTSAMLEKQIAVSTSQLMASRKDKLNYIKDTKQNIQNIKDILLGNINNQTLDAEYIDEDE